MILLTLRRLVTHPYRRNALRRYVVLSEHRPETGNKPTVESTRGGRRLPQLQRDC